MNKKFFAALSLAGVLLSQGSVVLATEMEEVESGSVPGTDVEQASTVKLDDVNFPDTNFRDAVAQAYGTAAKTDTPEDGTNLKTDFLEDITELTDSEGKPFKDLTGIEYLTGLTTVSLTYSPNLKIADFSNNGELTSIEINPATDLYSLTLPEETGNLDTLIVSGATQLTTLDLSAYTALETVDLSNNELASLKVSSSVTDLNVSGNDLTGLDLSANSGLTTLNASQNNLYEITFPSGKKLITVLLSHNKLASVDLSTLKGVTDLDLSDNRLESLDLSNNANLANLDVSYNHLAALDVSGTKVGADEAEAAEDGEEGATPTVTTAFGSQYLYANSTDDGIDLTSYDENFQSLSKGLGYDEDSVTGGNINKGIFEFDTDAEADEDNNSPYSYIYQVGNAESDSDEMTVYIVKADLMNRLYNPNSGEHFYTMDLNEKDTLVKLGWQAEGIGWVAPEENSTILSLEAGEAVFRLYNPNAGDHHYTKDSKEKDVLVRAGWNYEGVGWYSAKEHADAPVAEGEGEAAAETPAVSEYTIEVYREYNPNAKEAGAHNYTTSENENDTLVALGWLDEGIGWWALK